LNKENTEFSNALLQQNNSKIAEREKEIQGYKEMIAEKENQLNLLTQEIEKHKQVIHALSNKIETDAQQINKTKIDFEVTFDFIMLQLEDDIKKIKLYLE
jgi:predicted  nucleic acid-binding Zn-ribbon protein